MRHFAIKLIISRFEHNKAIGVHASRDMITLIQSAWDFLPFENDLEIK